MLEDTIQTTNDELAKTLREFIENGIDQVCNAKQLQYRS